ncbi:AAA family ATPase [Paracoccus sp. YLB-12]|uniref:AAA family ATPase n=1 Tax=Paracoccus maritimus TaxID=2933292 RepID=A0ABT2KEA5_9RHOB|nr:AAA family ATPase [Paracoccus sp. YLB-12]MCT4334870.1 AAA family ATPase [Paracoccus sp. YLB-12]
MNGAGVALRWIDLAAFARRAIDMATGHRNRVASSQGWVFFYCGLLGAAIALEEATGLGASSTLSGHARFHHQVFLTSPWPEIHHRDSERRQDVNNIG